MSKSIDEQIEQPQWANLDAGEVLRRFRQHCVNGIMSDTPYSMTLEEAEEAIKSLIAQAEKEAKEVAYIAGAVNGAKLGYEEAMRLLRSEDE